MNRARIPVSAFGFDPWRMHSELGAVQFPVPLSFQGTLTNDV
ncbi:hypothetical protein V1277_005554 [Bradyrhizobium sp. AZCC 1588]